LKWKPFDLNGLVYDLAHLHPFSFDFVLAAKDDAPERVYPIDVTFSLHCFTEKLKDGEDLQPDLAYNDNRETRHFDVKRYECSKQLPGIIRSLGERKCFHAVGGNFFTVHLMMDAGVEVEYSVYFKMSRGSTKGRLTLYVTSAYIQDGVPRAKPHPRKPIRFSVIAFNTANNKAIKRPP
jgi:hypothetical protein